MRPDLTWIGRSRQTRVTCSERPAEDRVLMPLGAGHQFTPAQRADRAAFLKST